MPRRVVRHGCLQAAIAAFLVAAALEGGEPVLVRSRVVDIEYTVNADALPLDSVRLWYSLDRGETWLDGGVDEDRQSPLLFDAPQEGLYGFFLVLSNATGPSSVPPARATQPHLWAFVDYTMPVVQLHPPRQTTMLGHRVLQIRWTAIDTHLGPRPVEIMYQRLPGREWYSVTDAPLPNTGRYDWRLPTDLDGSVAVCVMVSACLPGMPPVAMTRAAGGGAPRRRDT